MEIKEKGIFGKLFCKHDYQEGVLSNPKYPNFQNISGERITTICVKCGKIKDSYFRHNIDGS